MLLAIESHALYPLGRPVGYGILHCLLWTTTFHGAPGLLTDLAA
jgi:hypothetical protein